MKKYFRSLLLASIVITFFSCEGEENLPYSVHQKSLESGIIQDKELLEFLSVYGFDLSNVEEYPDFYLIEGCISVNKEGLREGKYAMKSDPRAHARTTNVVNSTPWNIRTIRIMVDFSVPTSGIDNWRTEISQAINDLNSVNNFRLQFLLVTSGSYDILIRSDNNILNDDVIAQAEFPASGNPGFQIQINLDFGEFFFGIPGGWNVPSGVKRRNIVHEIGHCIGYRHTNHPVSGRNGGPELPSTIGLHEIPGTWSNDPGSVMNGLTALETWNGFSVLDILAHRAVYPIDPGESPLFTYVKNVSSALKLHNWTGEWSEFGNSSAGFNYRGYTGFVYLYPKAGTVPLYRYIHTSNTLYLTTNPNLSSTYPSYTLQKTIGYVYPSSGANRIPVYEYYNNNEGHFFTTNYGDAWVSGPGWSGGGISFFVEEIM